MDPFEKNKSRTFYLLIALCCVVVYYGRLVQYLDSTVILAAVPKSLSSENFRLPFI